VFGGDLAHSPELAQPDSTGTITARGIPNASPWWQSIPWQLIATSVAIVVIALMVALLPLTYAMLAMAGLAIGVLILLRADVGLWLLAVLVPFGSLRPITFSGMSLTATDFMVMLVLASWLLRGLARRDLRIYSWSILAPLICFLAIVMISAINAVSMTATYKELLRWAELLAIYVVASNHLRRRWQIYALITAILASASAESLLGIYQFFTRTGPESFLTGGYLRAYGTFEQPNPFAGYLEFVLPIALCLVVLSLFGLRKNQAKSFSKLDKWFFVLAWGSCGLMGLAIMMSQSRGALLGLAAGVAVMIAISSKRGILIVATLVLFLVLCLGLGVFNILPSEISGRIGQITEYFSVFDVRGVEVTSENWAVLERMARWQAAWEMFQANPWFGVGVGNYISQYKFFALDAWPNPLGHAHNIYLHMTAEAGIIGGAGYVLLIALWLVSGGRVVRKLRARLKLPASLEWPDQRVAVALALGLLGALVAVSIHNGFDNLYVHDLNVQVGMTLGLLTALGTAQYSEKHSAQHSTQNSKES
jgi:O-antigen ligase